MILLNGQLPLSHLCLLYGKQYTLYMARPFLQSISAQQSLPWKIFLWPLVYSNPGRQQHRETGGLLLVFPLSNNSLAATHGQKRLCGNFRIQV